MTICINAISEYTDDEGVEKEAIVFSADRMVSTSTGQFEHSIKKHRLIGKNTIAMLSGNALLFDDLLKDVKSHMCFHEIKSQIIKNFNNLREDYLKTHIYDIYKIDAEFVRNLLRNPIPNPFSQEILSKVSEFSLETGVLLAGFVEGKAQISEINETGSNEFREINFHAIGSGMIQALNTLLFQKHSKEDSIKISIYNVFKAKKNAEVSIGVGKETDLFVLKENQLEELNQENIDILRSIYEEELLFGKGHKSLSKISGKVCKECK